MGIALSPKNILIKGESHLGKQLHAGLDKLGHNVVRYPKAEQNPEKSTEESTPKKESAPKKPASPAPDMVVWIQDLPESPTPLIQMEEPEWLEACEVEIKSALDSAVKYYEALKAGSSKITTETKASGGINGRLIFVIPTLAMGGAEGFAASAGAGEAVRILSKSLAKTWGKDSILVHTLAVHPTHFLGQALGQQLSYSMSLSDPALSHVGTPETDLAGILDLVSQSGSDFWTGATLTLDGGIWMA